MAEMLLCTNWKGTSLLPSFLTGWCATMREQPLAAASSTTSGVMSSVTSTFSTGPPQSTSKPGLSQLSASSSGAMRCIPS